MKSAKVRSIDRNYEIMRKISSGADDEVDGNDDEFHTPPIPDDGIVTRSGKTLFYDTH